MGPFGSQLLKGELVAEGILVLGIEHVLNKCFNDTGVKFITDEKFDQLKGFEAKPGEVLITMMGTIGRTAVVPDGIRKSIIGSHLLKMKLRRDIFPQYIAWVLSYLSPVYKQMHLGAQGAIMQGLNTGIVKKLSFPLPPTYDDQVAIVNELERKMANVEKMRQSVFRQKEAGAAMQGAILRQAFPYNEREKLPEGWRAEDFKNCIINKSVNTRKILESKYLREGKYPIVDQSGNLIAGYTNDESLVYNHEVPVIVFGDHTRIFKYIDFNFAVGADGTKIIHPNPNVVNPKYFYFVLGHADFPNDGYNRHYKYIKTLKLPLPRTLDDQIAVAKELERKGGEVEKIQQAVDEQLEAVEALPGAVLREVFEFEEQTIG